MKTVLIDASSAILLFKADLFLPCTRSFSLVMAEEVFKEVTVNGYPGAGFFKTLKTKMKIQAPVRKAVMNIGKMDQGEQDTLVLYTSLESSFIIMDDGRGAKYCCSRGIPFINALLVPKIFWYSGCMDQKTYMKKTERLIELGRYSQKIINTAKTLSKTDLAGFVPNEH